MKKIKAFLKDTAKQSIPLLAGLFGAKILSKQATLKKLAAYQMFSEPGVEVTLPPAGETGLPVADIYAKSQVVTTSAIGVYRVSDKIKIHPYGGVQFGREVLDMDFGSALFVKTLLKTDKRPVIKCDTCIVLWSHEWGNGYFDYTYFIYAKLLRIKNMMPEAEFKKAKIIYPLVHTAFEQELLKYAGVTADQILDSKTHNVQATHYYTGNNDSWYYPNKSDLNLLRQTLLPQALAGKTSERVYISRKARRRLTNEAEVIRVLKEFDFDIIEDAPKTVAEQIALYKNAKVIIGPHGASYTNIINCTPGTILIELFPGGYYPDYFRSLSSALNMNYYAIFEDNIGETHYRNLADDLTIDPEKIKIALQNILTIV
ncbi:glycosyltransferase family 61 protein [Mucilaginibacter sp. S1162]|uniref:Glycosyltransferase family 61 protein n=1 Tax=Mucilaginibacter humi TaxID=2732510 RepID=A0ABX1VZ86_9SPHI|nr:glycosyltransferase family 61 protein [Mucilaginibacter humi]NNU32993.1 glycosyltransferase family 61 protein [Mucilaginibacter humi]